MKHVRFFALSICSIFFAHFAFTTPLHNCPQCGLLPFPQNLLSIEEEWTSTHQALAGSWENSADAPDILVAEGICASREQALSARLTYTFHSSGRFEKTLEATELGASLLNSGHWRISQDEKYILLDYSGVDAPYTEVIVIRHLDGDELVLDTALAFQKAASTAVSKELFFNKL